MLGSLVHDRASRLDMGRNRFVGARLKDLCHLPKRCNKSISCTSIPLLSSYLIRMLYSSFIYLSSHHHICIHSMPQAMTLHHLLRTHLPTFLKHLDLIRHLLQAAQHLLVSPAEAVNHIWNLCISTELPNILLCLAKVVSGHAREEVMHGLKLEAAVEEVQPGGAVDVHGGAEHPLRK